jgi:hypothetical protein
MFAALPTVVARIAACTGDGLSQPGFEIATMLSDTHPDAERVQIELLRQTSAAQRFRMTVNLTAALVDSSRRTIAAQNPDLSPRELSLRCVQLYYGEALAERLRDYLRTIPEQEHVVG